MNGEDGGGGLVEKSWMYGFLLILFRFLENASCLCVISTNSRTAFFVLPFSPDQKFGRFFPLTIVPSPPYHVLLRVGARAFVDSLCWEFSLP